MCYNEIKEALFMHIFIHILEHSFIDSVKILPFIFLVYLIIEYIEHKNNTHLSHTLMKSGKLGGVFGGILGSIPQCGFSVIASDLYSKRAITLGTMLAIFIATSDEAIPIILSEPSKAHFVILVILIKVIIAIIFGTLIDFILNKKDKNICEEKDHHHHFHGNCEDCQGGILKTAFIHTIKIFIFLFVATFALTYIIEIFGEDKFSYLLLKNSYLQPFISSLIGLIPNCAASVILTKSFLEGAISFGSLIAGLSSGAGVGLLVLYKRNKNLTENIKITLVLYLIGAFSGLLIQILL